jgi:uncharacterized protein involved in exopolysaccharide biosynthesis
MRARLIAIVLAALAPAAAAQGVYRCVDAQGRVGYTDKPAGPNCTLQRIEVPPSSAGGRPPGLSESEKKLLEQADRRAAELDRATADMVSAFEALRAAEARRDQGVQPLEGERQGRRYRPEYWQRQQALKRDVDLARAKLEDALARRNALR